MIEGFFEFESLRVDFLVGGFKQGLSWVFKTMRGFRDFFWFSLKLLRLFRLSLSIEI